MNNYLAVNSTEIPYSSTESLRIEFIENASITDRQFSIIMKEPRDFTLLFSMDRKQAKQFYEFLKECLND